MPREVHYNAAEHIAATTADPYLRPAFSIGNRLARLLWGLCWGTLYRFSPRPFHGWRALLLRCFGAKMGPNCHFYPRSKVWAPWNLICVDQVTAGDGAEIYNPAPIRLGSHAILSQDAYLCGATHDYDDPAFPLRLAIEASVIRDSGLPVILHILHPWGGGTEKQVVDLMAATATRATSLALIITPPAEGATSLGLALFIPDANGGRRVDLRVERLADIGRLLRAFGLQRIHVHHALTAMDELAPFLANMNLPYDLSIHD